MKKVFAKFLSFVGNAIGWAIIVPVGMLIGALGLFQIAATVLVPAWLLWEFWPFQNELSQRLAYSEIVDTKTAVMKKINVVEFELNINQQRVIQKIIAPVRGVRGRPYLCNYLGVSCPKGDASKIAEEKGFSEIWPQLPSKDNLLNELSNCTIKSADDWICKSDWYGATKNLEFAYIGKSNNKWISNPPLNKPNNWKVGLVFDKLRCGGNICFVYTIEERKRL